jgi:hypothetical protein
MKEAFYLGLAVLLRVRLEDFIFITIETEMGWEKENHGKKHLV